MHIWFKVLIFTYQLNAKAMTTTIDTLKNEVDFRITSVESGKFYIRFKNGIGKLVGRRELNKLKSTMTWTTDF